MTKRIGIKVTGTVQGVGFRPTVYKHATSLGLTGNVNNSAQGVLIEIQGAREKIVAFIELLKTNPPPQAKVATFETDELDLVNDEKDFLIVKSKSHGDKNVHISSDLATCQECLSEINDTKNRRANYPFTNCTNCGPRFTIIKDRPYDRQLTTMDSFEMCPLCQEEYDNPQDRRFHAQPNACKSCGPKLHLLNLKGDPIAATIKELKNGKIAAIKGLGGFNISCIADSAPRLRQSKKRPHKAFAVMMRDLTVVNEYCFINDLEIEWLTSSAAPIILLRKKSGSLDHLSPDNNYLGIMLPYTPLHHLLMREFELLVMTSANLKDEPISIDDADIEKLIEQGIVDFGLSHNRPIAHRADDSILQIIAGKTQMIRSSRGFTPSLFNCDTKSDLVLALGANMKNSFALKKGSEVYLSQHIGELIDFRNYEYQKEQIKDLSSLLEIDATIVHGDAHPGYENASQVKTPIFHHHAHLLSVMGEHKLLGKEVLGIIADGTGFGTDETIWGFEFLKVGKDHQKFTRVAHLAPFILPGGEKAIKEIDRIAIALGAPGFEREKQIQQLIDSKLNTPKTSSLGRLFDGVCAMLRLTERVEYEGRGAILLQKSAEKCPAIPDEDYPLSVHDSVIQYWDLVKAIQKDIDGHQPKSVIAYKFHLWVVKAMINIISIEKPLIVAFSGGCFQNRLLVSLLKSELEVEAYFNEMVPTNDGGIALGQAIF